jgi:hypothetical protein
MSAPTGKTWILAGLRFKRRVCLLHDADGPGRYDFAGCDHVNYCCSRVRIHVSPHLGCLMR